MDPDCIVVRHGSAGVPHQLAKVSRAAIVNAGDGANEHPTQALLDAMTIREHKSRIDGLEGRDRRRHPPQPRRPVEHSSADQTGCKGPGRGSGNAGSERFRISCRERPDDVPARRGRDRGADVVMILRIQRERQDSAYFPTLREYSIHYGLTNERLDLAKKDAIVLHPGPMNRGIEIASDVADSSRSLILDQVKYGVAVRMAVLYLATGGSMGNA